MSRHLFPLATLALALPLHGQAELNRLDLDNGGDILWFINSPYIGSDPANGNFNGDLYWKVYPSHAIQRASGASILWGVEFSLFDLDWSDFSPLWAYLITTSSPGTDLNLEPSLTTTGPGVFVPQVDNTGLTSPSPGTCPKPGYVGGWIISDLFADTATGSLIPLMQASSAAGDDYFVSDGTVDWSFVHFFPGNNQSAGPQDVFQPSPNGCGSGFSGSASFQWVGSTDGVAPFGDGGENAGPMTLAPDGQGTGGTTTGANSKYGGFQIGGNGAPASILIPEVQSGGADLSFFIEGSPTLNLAVNTQYTVNGAIAPQIGTGSIEIPIGWDTDANAPALKDGDGGVPGSSPVTVGGRMYDQSASTTPFSSIGVLGVNIDFDSGPIDLLIDTLGSCFPVYGGDFCLNPVNPVFNPMFNSTLGLFTGYTPDPANPGERVYSSPQYPVAPDPCLLGVTLGWQGWTVEVTNPPGSEFAGSSNVIRSTFRANSNVQ